jgi:hypothetical protein
MRSLFIQGIRRAFVHMPVPWVGDLLFAGSPRLGNLLACTRSYVDLCMSLSKRLSSTNTYSMIDHVMKQNIAQFSYFLLFRHLNISSDNDGMNFYNI